MARGKKELKPVNSAGIGHNSELTDEQKQGLHLNNHVPSYERALKAKKDADAAFKNVCKTIKSEGGSIDEVKLTISLRTPEGEALLKATLEQSIKIARWNGLAIGTQGDLFGPDRRPIEERAFEEGKRAGLSGENCQPPHQPGTGAYDKWIEGWHAGQAVLASGFNKTPSDTELLRPESEDEGQTDDFDAAANGGLDDESYAAGDEVEVMSENDAASASGDEIPEFLKRTETVAEGDPA